MKKKLVICLVLALLVSTLLGACQSSGKADNKGGLQVGYSKVNITPNFPVVLGGYGDYENRIYDLVLDYLYIRPGICTFSHLSVASSIDPMSDAGRMAE